MFVWKQSVTLISVLWCAVKNVFTFWQKVLNLRGFRLVVRQTTFIDQTKGHSLQSKEDTEDAFTSQGAYTFLFIESISFGLKMAGSPLCLSTEALCHCYKNILLLICTASAFSERYLGMPLRDDSRYQVRVFCLPALVCRWSLKSITPLPTVKLSQLLNIAAIKVRSSGAFPFSCVCGGFFMLCRILSLISLW